MAYFDPDDQDSFVAGLNALLDQGLCNRLIEAGLNRAQLFSWDRVSERVLGALSSLVEN